MTEGIEIGLNFFLKLVGAFAIVFVLVNTGVAYSKGTIDEKLNIAEDIGMQMNTMESLPGDAYIVNRNLHGYSLNVVGNKIEVYSEVYDTFRGIYYFPKSTNINLDVKLIKPKQVVVSKINGELKISEAIPMLS